MEDIMGDPVWNVEDKDRGMMDLKARLSIIKLLTIDFHKKQTQTSELATKERNQKLRNFYSIYVSSENNFPVRFGSADCFSV